MEPPRRLGRLNGSRTKDGLKVKVLKIMVYTEGLLVSTWMKLFASSYLQHQCQCCYAANSLTDLFVQQKIFYFPMCHSNKSFVPPSYCGHIFPCLPHLFSQNVVFVLSVQAGELYHKLLHSKKHVNDFVVGDLASMERAEMVRRTLAVHRKALEESMFNNQVTKLENF